MARKEDSNVDKVEATGKQRCNLPSFVSCALLFNGRADGFSADVLLPSATGDMYFDQVKVIFLYNKVKLLTLRNSFAIRLLLVTKPSLQILWRGR